MHGGIDMTEECRVGAHVKRILRDDATGGQARPENATAIWRLPSGTGRAAKRAAARCGMRDEGM